MLERRGAIAWSKAAQPSELRNRCQGSQRRSRHPTDVAMPVAFRFVGNSLLVAGAHEAERAPLEQIASVGWVYFPVLVIMVVDGGIKHRALDEIALIGKSAGDIEICELLLARRRRFPEPPIPCRI